MLVSCANDFGHPLLGSILTTAKERLQSAINSARWNEDQHYRAAVGFRRDAAELLWSLDEAVPWDDVRRVIQGWCIARFRRRWGRGSDGNKQDEEKREESEGEEE